MTSLQYSYRLFGFQKTTSPAQKVEETDAVVMPNVDSPSIGKCPKTSASGLLENVVKANIAYVEPKGCTQEEFLKFTQM